MKIMRMTTMLVILLVMSIPAINAQSLTIVQYSGENGIEGMFNANSDRWKVIVNAQTASGSAISARQVKINNFNFNNCVLKEGTTYECSYTSNRFGLGEGTYNLKVDLYPFEGASSSVATQTKKLIGDGRKPVADKLAIIQKGSQVEIDYRFTDPSSSTIPCSGILDLEVVEVGTSTKLYSETFNTPSCVVEKKSTFPYKGKGDRSLLIKVRDRVGNMFSDVRKFTVDTGRPKIEVNTFVFGLADGSEIGNALPSRDTKIYATVQVTEDLGISTITADFSELGGKQENGKCEAQGKEKFLCRFDNVNVRPSTSKIYNIKITATDKAANSDVVTIQKTINIDNEQPEITAITAGASYGGEEFIGRKANITIRFNEQGSGISKEKVVANLGELNPRLTSANPSSCFRSSTGFDCVYENIDVLTFANNATVRLTRAADNAGFTAKGVSSQTFTIINFPPEIVQVDGKQISMLAIGPVGITTYAKQGDKISFRVNYTSTIPVTASGDFSSIMGPTGKNVPGFCRETSSMEGVKYGVCSFDGVGPVYESSNKEVSIAIRDAVGNSAVAYERINIYGSDVRVVPDFWIVEVADVGVVDRGVAGLINQRVYVPLIMEASGVSPLEVKVSECSGDTAYLVPNSPKLINNIESSSPYLKFEFKRAEFEKDVLEFQCTFVITSLRGNAVLLPELKTANVKILVQGQAGNTPDATVQKQIQDAKKKVTSGWRGLIGKLNEILEWAEKICRILKLIDSIRVLLMGTETVVSPAISAAALNPISSFFAKQTASTFCRASQTASDQEWFFTGMIKWCKFLDCDYSGFKEGESSFVDFFRNRQKAYEQFTGKYLDFGGQTAKLQCKLGLAPKQQCERLLKGEEVGASIVYQRQMLVGQYDYNPMDNIIVATGTLCLPGIIRNLQKARQIDCQYIDCLQTHVAAGIPEQACGELKHYQYCKYYVGSIFNAIPFFNFWDSIMGRIQAIIANPATILFSGIPGTSFKGVHGYCQEWCDAMEAESTGTTAGPLLQKHALCVGTALANTAAQIYQSYEAISKGFDFKVRDYCEQVGVE
ncbi:MAG: hypothetical protein QW331_02090 [Candidatus Woesearchaeota archaeon]